MKTLVTLNKKNLLIISLFIIVVGLGAFLRLYKIADVPGWYTDEGFYINSSWSLIHGSADVFGIKHWSFVSPFSPTPPLYHLVVGAMLAIFGKSIVVARVISVMFGLATGISLFYIGKQLTLSRIGGLVPAAAYLLIPEFVVNNRWAYPQTFIGLLMLWGVYLLYVYSKEKREIILWGSVGCTAAALLSTFWVWPVIIVYGIVLFQQSWKKAILGILGILAPLIIVLGIRWITIPTEFVQDAVLTVANFGQSALSLEVAFLRGALEFFTRDAVFILSLAGFVFIVPKKLRAILISAFAVMSAQLLAYRWNYVNWFYSALIFSPLLLVGLVGIVQALRQIDEAMKKKVSVFVYITLSIYFLFLAVTQIISIQNGSLTKNVSQLPFIIDNDTEQMEETVRFVNANTTSEEFVIAPNNINWKLRAFSVDPVWTACYEFNDQFSNLTPDRFSHDLSTENARYYVDDSKFMGDYSICGAWRVDIIDEIIEEKWKLVFSTDRFYVYENPENAR